MTGVEVLIIISGRRSMLNKQKREKGKLERMRGEESKRHGSSSSIASDA